MIPKDEKEALEFLKKEVGDDYVPWHLERTFRLMNQKEIECVRRLIRKFTEMIPADFSPKQKAALLFEILVKRGTYVDEENENRFVYVSALITGNSVCMGFSELYCILCYSLGIECSIVIGFAWNKGLTEDAGLHAWNIVTLPQSEKNGNVTLKYHVDVTWSLGGLSCDMKNSYFLKSDQFMEEHSHLWNKEYYKCPEDNREIMNIKKEEVKRICRILEKATALQLAMNAS